MYVHTCMQAHVGGSTCSHKHTPTRGRPATFVYVRSPNMQPFKFPAHQVRHDSLCSHVSRRPGDQPLRHRGAAAPQVRWAAASGFDGRVWGGVTIDGIAAVSTCHRDHTVHVVAYALDFWVAAGCLENANLKQVSIYAYAWEFE